MVFVFYQFNTSPVNFNPAASNVVQNSTYAYDYKHIEYQQYNIFLEKQQRIKQFINDESDENAAAIKALNDKDRSLRESAKWLMKLAAGEQGLSVETNDKDYVFIHFILNQLPRGLIGLLLAVILSAAMSSTASELNALSSTTTMDLYKRSFASNKDEAHYLKASKWFTLAWGILAIIIACVAYLADNLIQLVNIIGSIFYGNVLGIFLLAFFFKYIKANAVFVAALITQVIVITGWWFDWMPYLWLNVFGCALVMLTAFILQFLNQNTNASIKT
jgi:Na+/proline symporter